MRVPPPVITIIFAALMYVSDLLLPLEVFGSIELKSVSGVLLVVSLLLILPSVMSFYKSKTTVNPLSPEKATALVVSGLYQYSRNPMYLGMAIALFSWGLYLQNPINLAFLAGFVLLINKVQILPEEKALERLFGTEYLEYKERVRRWL